ncbi:MAG: DUF3301 domain-containing protein [Rhodocyclaceae bacterium]|nr:DUF3301 domain-containing protein [Rhodocyclaceae bacterium]
MPDLETLGFLVLGLLAWFWFTAIQARDTAMQAARKACDDEGLLLLDDTVSQTGLSPARDDEGRLRLRRSYEFEYSDTGDNRRRGSLVLLGGQVLLVNVGFRIVPAEPTDTDRHMLH